MNLRVRENLTKALKRRKATPPREEPEEVEHNDISEEEDENAPSLIEFERGLTQKENCLWDDQGLCKKKEN